MPGTLQAGLRQLFGSAASGLESASVSVCINLGKRQRVGADCQDKATSYSNAYFLLPKEPERSRFSRLWWPLAWPISWSAVLCQLIGSK